MVQDKAVASPQFTPPRNAGRKCEKTRLILQICNFLNPMAWHRFCGSAARCGIAFAEKLRGLGRTVTLIVACEQKTADMTITGHIGCNKKSD